MIELPEGVEREEVPVEKRYRSATSALMNRIRRLYEELYSRFGEDGLELIRDVSTEFGGEVVERARKRGVGPDTKSVALYIARIFENVGGEGKIVIWTDDQVVIRIDKCPYPFKDPKICDAHTTMEKVVVEALGPGLRYRIDKSMPRGDAYCSHIIQKKG
jgi:hypothetical protein